MDVRLPDLLSAFRAAHPAVDVVISEVVSDAMIDGVRTGSLDFAFVVRREQARTSGLGHEEFLTEPYALAVSRSHALARRRRVRLTELVEEPFILHRPGSAVRELILDACAEAGYRPRIALETGEISAARAFVASGLGITILPRSSLLSAGPKVHIIDIGPPNLTRTSDMTWSRTRPLSTAATAFPRLCPIAQTTLALNRRDEPRSRTAPERLSPSGIRAVGWSIYGAKRAQPVATGGKCDTPENRSNKPIRNRWQPTATVSERMVRRGSTVRVRQRALQ
jgi:LysR substrate binding domain